MSNSEEETADFQQEYVIDCPRCGHCCPQRVHTAGQGLTFDEQEMLRLCPHFGPSPARDEWIAGYKAAHGIGEKK